MVEISLFFSQKCNTFRFLLIFIVIHLTMNKKTNKKTEHLVVRITPIQLNMIMKHIEQEKGITMSDFIRTAINKQIYTIRNE